MSETLEILSQYGYLVLFAFVLAEQIGLPIPAVPVLLGVGALTGAGRMSLALAFGAVLAASLPRTSSGMSSDVGAAVGSSVSSVGSLSSPIRASGGRRTCSCSAAGKLWSSRSSSPG